MTRTPCERCEAGWLTVYCSRRSGDRVTRYFSCWLCSWKPDDNKLVTTATETPSRAELRTRCMVSTSFQDLANIENQSVNHEEQT